MSQRFEHKKTGWAIEIKDLTQGDTEAWAAAYRRHLPEKSSAPIDVRGATVRAAVEAGILLEPKLTVTDVNALPPAQVAWMEGKINAVYMEATTIPPE